MIQSVRIARLSTEVKATSKVTPGLEQLSGPLGFGSALLGEIDVVPAREQVFLVPDALAVAKQDDLRHGFSYE